MAEPIISVSGLRGIVGETLTPHTAIRYVTAFASTLPAGAIVITRDGRPSGEMIARAVHAGLNAVGRDTIDGGIVATPTAGILIRQAEHAVGGVQITASHNPIEYNGLKLMTSEGRVIPAGPGQQVLEHYRGGTPGWVPHDWLGTMRVCPDTVSAHISAIRSTVDFQRIKKCRFKVLLDSNHGAGSILGRKLLEELGCEVTVLGDRPDGQFEHTPEPTAENLAQVLAKVPKFGAQIGFCQDPDADRLAVIDETGRYLGEEYTLAIIVDHVLRERKGPVVTNCATSRMTEDLAKRYGQPFYRSAVGEPNVADLMLEKKAVFGGEGNGGPIDPRVGLVRDSFVGMAQLLDAMAQREQPISRLADELPRYEIVKKKIDLSREKVSEGLAALESRFQDAQGDRLDGLRLDWPDAWLLVRPSNTEPIVRAFAEAETSARAQQLCDEAAAVLAEI